MVLVITDNRVKDRDAYLPLAKAFAADGANDKGCHEMNVYVDPGSGEPRRIRIEMGCKRRFSCTCAGRVLCKTYPGNGAVL